MNKPALTQAERELKQVQAKVQAGMAQLANLNAEITAVRQRRTALAAEVTAETEQAKASRRRELDELERIHRETMKGIDAERNILRDEKSRLEQEKLDTEKDLAAARDELEHTKNTLARYKTDVKNEADSLKALEQTVAALAAQADRYTAQNKPLKYERGELQTEVASLREEKTRLVSETNTMRSGNKAEVAEHGRRVQLLAAKEDELKTKLRAYREHMDGIRDELATRQHAMDERERVLIRREFKVNQKEATVAQNSDLLNL